MTAAVAEELRDSGVRVNAVQPGWLKTAMGGPYAPRPVEEGAERIIEIAMNMSTSVARKFFFNGADHAW
jgi:NAD(P)-dependent dehydrogenase (short-subunit alcohol dehydrogenase family)